MCVEAGFCQIRSHINTCEAEVCAVNETINGVYRGCLPYTCIMFRIAGYFQIKNFCTSL